MRHRQAFVLMDFLFGLIILALIAIIVAKATLTLQRYSLAKSSQSLVQIEASNAADIIRNYLEAESSFHFVDSTLSFAAHTITLQNSTLFLDGIVLMQNVARFDVRALSNNAFSIDICSLFGTQIHCINRVGWLQ